MSKKKGEAVDKESGRITEDELSWLNERFPQVFSEGKIDWENLHLFLGGTVDEAPERYNFSWSGRRDAVRILQVPSRATLVPIQKESEDFDKTQNLFIEGDNLEVLKLLYKPYYKQIKLVYIDPPYNTGKDFVYSDNYKDPLEVYLQITNQKDEQGNLLTTNPESSGRYHSKWLSMMYPRLFVARQLLTDDGLIIVSIDDHELFDLRLIMNDLFGEENFIANLVWEKGRKNDAKLFSVGHEYMVIYAKSLLKLRDLKTIWRESKPGALEIWNEYLKLKSLLRNNDKAVEKAIQKWYKDLPDKNPSKLLSRYKHVDKWGPWRDRDISWPGGGGPRYDVIHPVTKKPCKVPERGWGFSSPEKMQEQIKLGLIVFREDESEPPFRKAHLRPLPEELDEEQSLDFDEESDIEIGMQVMGSYIYKQSQVAVKYLRELMEGNLFENPKDHEILARIISYCTNDKDIVMDFFAGAASTAEAVLQLNSKLKENRQFIMVQLPEITPVKSNARNAGYKTVADIGKERIRRVIKKLDKKHKNDYGFKVFKLSESNFQSWSGATKYTVTNYMKQLENQIDSLKKGSQEEAIIYEVALREGFKPTCSIETVTDLKKNRVLRVTNSDNSLFLICLDTKLDRDTLKKLDLKKDQTFICRDSALDDSMAANLALQCRLKTL